MLEPSGQQILLSNSGYELVVVAVGGGIRSLALEGRPLLDGYRMDEMCSGGRGQILAPWPNRLEDGRYEWAGQQYQTPLSEPEHGNAIHGLVRWSAWHLAESGADTLRMEHRLHPQPGWPWTLDLAVTYRLGPDGLSVTTTATNAGVVGGAGGAEASCPFGLGWHPYLSADGGKVDDEVLTLPARTFYEADERGLPGRRLDVAGTDLDFRFGAPIGAVRLDTVFEDLERDDDGLTRVRLTPGWGGAGDAGGGAGGEGLELWMDPGFTHVMVYSGDTLAEPARRRRGLAIEPMTCAPNMLRSGDGLRVIEEGQTFEAAWGLRAFRFE